MQQMLVNQGEGLDIVVLAGEENLDVNVNVGAIVNNYKKR